MLMYQSTQKQKPLLHLSMMLSSGPDPLNSSRNGSYLLSCFNGAWQKITDRLLTKTRGMGQDMCIAFVQSVFLAKVNPPLSFQVPVMSVGLLLCCLLWLFNSILSFLAHVVKMLFILDVECAGSPSVGEPIYSFSVNRLFHKPVCHLVMVF